MSKRSLATLTLCVLGVSSFAMNGARTQELSVSADGCAVLGELIDNGLTHKRWFGEVGSGLLLANFGQTNVTICDQTARTVTGAFTSTLAQMNIDVSWGYYPGHDNDKCHSTNLSQCHPDRLPLLGGGISNSTFVLDTWRVVKQAVVGTMPLGSAGDTSRFSAGDFRTTLSRALRQDTLRATPNYQ